MRRVVWMVVLLMFVTGVLPVRAQPTATLMVFAAASLTDAFEALGDAFEAAHPDVDVLFNFAASSTLSAQIIEGAPADVFASANMQQMTLVRNAGLIDGRARFFARNRLVLVTPLDNPANIQTLADLALPGVRLVVAAEGVPARVYTDSMLDLLAADPTYGADFVAAVETNIVSEEQNVRQALAKVLLGETDAAIIYQSDVTPLVAEQVNVITIPDEFNIVARYPIAALDSATQPELARAFMAFVLSEEGQTILESWNFVPVTSRPRLLAETIRYGCD
jgi:molybdate transport system substrate-binding protein